MWTWSTLNVTRLVLITRKLLPGHGNTIRLYSYLIKEFSNSLSVMQWIVYKFFFFYNDTQNRNASVPHVSHKSSKLKQFIFPKIKSCKFRGFFFINPYTRVLHDYVWVITFTFFQQQKMKYAVCTEHGTISNWEQQNARNSQFCQHVPSWFVYNTIM